MTYQTAAEKAYAEYEEMAARRDARALGQDDPRPAGTHESADKLAARLYDPSRPATAIPEGPQIPVSVQALAERLVPRQEPPRPTYRLNSRPAPPNMSESDVYEDGDDAA